MEFFGFCEGTFDCLLAPGVDSFAVGRLRKRIRLFQIVLPNMARHQPSCHGGGNALLCARTASADAAVAPVFPVAGTVGGFPCQFLFLWTKVNVSVLLVYETVFPKALAFVRMPAVPNDRLNTTGSNLVTGGSVVVSRVNAHISGQMSQPLFHVIQNIRHRIYIVDVGGREENFLKIFSAIWLSRNRRARLTLMVVASGAFSVSPRPQNHL